MSSLLRLKRQQDDFFKSFWSLHITLSFLVIWSWNDKYVHTIPQFPRKPYTIPDQNGQNLSPFSDQNGAKTKPLGAAPTYMGYIRGLPPPRPSHSPFSNRNGTKNIPFGAAAYLYGLKKGVFSSPRPPQFLMAEDSWVSLGWMGGGGVGGKRSGISYHDQLA